MGSQRTVTRLSDEELIYIVRVLSEQNTTQIARQLGRSYYTVRKAIQRIERGWATRLTWTTCAVCGGPLCHGPARRVVHPWCKRVRVAYLAREKRKRPHTPSTKYVADWRGRNPDANDRQREQEKKRAAEKRRQEWTAEQWKRSLTKAWAADQRDQEATLSHARRTGERWTAAEDEYILATLKVPAREVGKKLGRTLWAVRVRRVRLRRTQGSLKEGFEY